MGTAMGSERRRGSVSWMASKEAAGRSTWEFFAETADLNEPIKAPGG